MACTACSTLSGRLAESEVARLELLRNANARDAELQGDAVAQRAQLESALATIATLEYQLAAITKERDMEAAAKGSALLAAANQQERADRAEAANTGFVGKLKEASLLRAELNSQLHEAGALRQELLGREQHMERDLVELSARLDRAEGAGHALQFPLRKLLWQWYLQQRAASFLPR
eukprot:gene15309-24597_t